MARDNLTQAAARLEQVVPQLLDRLEAAEERTQRFVFSLVLERSSGRYSLALLAAIGHPYAKANPHPPMHPGIINVQSGVFKRSWQDQEHRRPDYIGFSIWNNAPHAMFLEHGTDKMIERPLVELVMLDARPYHEQQVKAALRAMF